MKLATRNFQFLAIVFTAVIGVMMSSLSAQAQVAPRENEIAAYDGLLKAAHEGNITELEKLIKAGADLEQTDRHERTAFHIAGFAGNHAIMRALAKAGADVNALDHINAKARPIRIARKSIAFPNEKGSPPRHPGRRHNRSLR